MNISGMMSGMGGMPNLSAMRDKMFQKADVNGDKGISLEEFTEVGKKLPGGGQAKDASELFSKIDTDGNGSLTKDEMKTFEDRMSSQMQSMMLQMQEKMSGGGKPDLDALFNDSDSDGNGSISRKEFDAVKADNPLAGLLSEDEGDDLFKSLDTDADGAVSKEEFKTFADRMKEQVQALGGGEPDLSLLMQGVNAYGGKSGSNATTDLTTKLLDILNSGDDKSKDDKKSRVEARA